MSDVLAERRAQMFPTLEARRSRASPRTPTRRPSAPARSSSTRVSPTRASTWCSRVRSRSCAPGINGEDPIVVHHAGEFTGEMSVLAGRRSLVRGRMGDDGEVLDLDPRGVPARHPERHRAERAVHARLHPATHGAHGAGWGTRSLIGSAHSAGTLRLQEFFTRNGHPYAYIDVEHDTTSRRSSTASTSGSATCRS